MLEQIHGVVLSLLAKNGMNHGYNVGNNGYMGTSQSSSTSTNQHPMKPEATEES